ncbi:hypothetical protein FQA39_LY11494 [Lamprigera yunnana]|nr:hypothetical protein FQA39_LY11494 [Lamprigera yunnana]
MEKSEEILDNSCTQLQALTNSIKAIPSKDEEEHEICKKPTNYWETLTHLLKGNVGPGIFSMGYAFKNSGMVMGLVLVPFLSLICVHSQHVLLNAARHVKSVLHLKQNPDFATTVELCFIVGSPRLKKWAPFMKTTVNLFICLTQLGFCCVYFVFISKNIQQVMDNYRLHYSVHAHMAFILVPILLICLLQNLKYLAPISLVANLLTLGAIAITLYYCCQPPFMDVVGAATIQQFPIFFGTTLYAFEGIALVLPLQNEMRQPQKFEMPLGVLNIGMVVVTILFSLLGAFSYLKYGSYLEDSVTLSLPPHEIPAQVVKVAIALGVLLTFALQFYVPIEIMYSGVHRLLNLTNKRILGERIFRILFVFLVFTLAELIPFLGLFISLVGSLCTTAIGLIVPQILELILIKKHSKRKWLTTTKNCFIIVIGLLGCATGTYESIRLIVKAFQSWAPLMYNTPEYLKYKSTKIEERAGNSKEYNMVQMFTQMIQLIEGKNEKLQEQNSTILNKLKMKRKEINYKIEQNMCEINHKLEVTRAEIRTEIVQNMEEIQKIVEIKEDVINNWREIKEVNKRVNKNKKGSIKEHKGEIIKHLEVTIAMGNVMMSNMLTNLRTTEKEAPKFCPSKREHPKIYNMEKREDTENDVQLEVLIISNLRSRTVSKLDVAKDDKRNSTKQPTKKNVSVDMCPIFNCFTEVPIVTLRLAGLANSDLKTFLLRMV